MKTTYLSLLCLIILSASKCKKAGDDCHYKITIANHSNDSIIAALRFTNTEGKCILSGPVILPGGNYQHAKNGCWENELGNSKTYELYIVDPAHYNPSKLFYSCDSIEHYNTVLKHFVLTLDDLKNTDFMINYP